MTSLPILPKPTIPKVLPLSSVPMRRCRFHSFCFNSKSPFDIFLDNANIIATVCSAADIVFTSGVFITTTPILVAAEISILSIPTPARPIARNFFETFIIFASILVPLLIIHPEASVHALIISLEDAS